MSDVVAGVTSTGSKRPDALFGHLAGADGLPVTMRSASGCRVHTSDGREYVDFIMALGAVSLGYAHPAVVSAAEQAVRDGAVGPLPPELEAQVAERLVRIIPGAEQVRFLKSGAEAVAAAVRLARVHTDRELVLSSGYHGWHDWNQEVGAAGVPRDTAALHAPLPFDDTEVACKAIRAAGDRLAAVVVEPVQDHAPSGAWLGALREETRRVGAVLVFDEIKTLGRVAPGGAAARWGGEPDLVACGKAIANGFPLAAVAGSRAVMQSVSRTWISSTLATEFVSLAAAAATLDLVAEEGHCGRLGRLGARLRRGLEALGDRYPAPVAGVHGVPEMCALRFRDERTGAALAAAAARRGLLFKRTPWNFVSAAHDDAIVDGALATLDECLAELRC